MKEYSQISENNHLIDDYNIKPQIEVFEHRQLTRLRKYLEEGNKIPLVKDEQEKKPQLRSQKSSTLSNTSQDIENYEFIDYQYVIKCAQLSLMQTCVELLVFDQTQIFEKLRKQFKSEEKTKECEKGISQQRLINCEMTGQLYIEYVKKRKDRSSIKFQKTNANKNRGILEKLLSIIKYVGSIINKNNKNNFKLVFRGISIAIFCWIAYRKRFLFIKIIKQIVNYK